MVDVTLNVNSEKHEIRVAPYETLCEALGSTLGFTDIKNGCNRSECGACTVLIDGEAILSCITLAVQSEGKNILTIEGLQTPKTGEVGPIQESLVEKFGIQCGFCTPGMVMPAKALLNRNVNPSEEDVKDAIQGNLCRCTSY